MTVHVIEVGLLAVQGLQVAFLLLHDWVPLGRLTNIAAVRASDSRAKLIWTTVLSAVPFALPFVFCCLLYPRPIWPMWLRTWLWYTYVVVLLAVIRAWWLPYLGNPSAERLARFQLRFAGTHTFLPKRNGIAPDTLHVAYHSLVLLTLIGLALL